ncbi:hypothetical protein D3C80_1531820 [compost metagenome]
MAQEHHQYQHHRLSVHFYQFEHNFLQLPKYQPLFLRLHKHQYLRNLALRLHHLKCKLRNEQQRLAPRGFLFQHNFFLATFYHGIRKCQIPMFPFSESGNTSQLLS